VTPYAVTGLGVVSAIGIGREAFLDAVRAGARAESGHPPETFDPSAYVKGPAGVRLAEVRGFDATKYLGDKGLRSLDRLTKLLVVAARLALHDARLKRDGAWATTTAGEPAGPGPNETGMVVSNAYGSLEAITELDRVAVLEDARYINPSRFPLTVSNSAAGYVSIWEDLRALNVSVSDGNCGALDAVAAADAMLSNGRADALLVGGGEAMSEALFLAFHRLGTGAGLGNGGKGSKGGERPLLGEGSALVVLETPASATARGAAALGHVIGYGTAFHAPERDAALVYPSDEAMERAIEAALGDAGIAPGDVDLVVSGVSGLRRFDEAELAAIGRGVGGVGRATVAGVPVVAPKLGLGETLGAGGATAMASAIAYLGHTPAGGAPSYLVRGEVRGPVRTVLVTSLGYYGNASALVMRAAAS
jgi:3-oxoacyl-(acyl-carrier-protein) synthase